MYLWASLVIERLNLEKGLLYEGVSYWSSDIIWVLC